MCAAQSDPAEGEPGEGEKSVPRQGEAILKKRNKTRKSGRAGCKEKRQGDRAMAEAGFWKCIPESEKPRKMTGVPTFN